MGKHETNYAKIERDFYPTPSWATRALLAHIDIHGLDIWEPACGDGRMSKVLWAAGARVYSSDIVDRGYTGLDALRDYTMSLPVPVAGTITNPPFGPRGKLAEAFIRTGLRHLDRSFLALLLPCDFDSAKTRAPLFCDCPQFAGKVILTKRCKWFEDPSKPKKSPKENSAWFLWGSVPFRSAHPTPAPVIRYAPVPLFAPGAAS
jgi:hypothetical protein